MKKFKLKWILNRSASIDEILNLLNNNRIYQANSNYKKLSKNKFWHPRYTHGRNCKRYYIYDMPTLKHFKRGLRIWQ